MPKSHSTFAAEVADKRKKLVDHLEAAQALADEIRDGMTGYLIETALLKLREASWPDNLDRPE